MDSSNPRIFLALEFTLTQKNLKFIDKLKSVLKGSKIKWVTNDNYHLTLKFLGETPSYLIKNIEITLQQTLREFSAFNLKLKGLGSFGNNKPKVIWIGIEESFQLNYLHENIEDALVELGFNSEKRKFSPHLTLGRIKYITNPEQFNQIINKYCNKYFQEININNIKLYQSDLKPEGPIYTIIKEFRL